MVQDLFAMVPMPRFLRGGAYAGEPFHSTHTVALWLGWLA